jgi:hypothetical protein
MFEVVSKTVWYTTKNGETKYKYVLTDDITVFWWDSLKYPVIFDTKLTENVGRYKWYINRSGYAQKDDVLMHHLVYGDNHNSQHKQIVHLNGFKLDNRCSNLHIVEGRGILTDRVERVDKKPPPQELVDVGVTQLPRFVRWDSSEKKFIIQNHPTLQRDVDSKLRTKPIISGSKSSKMGIVEKYSDILVKLQDLDKRCPTFNESKFNVKEQLAREYLAVCNAIRHFDGGNLVFVVPSQTPSPSPSPNTICSSAAETRKKKANELELPKYCTYRPATKGRGDMFVIERHPTLIANNRTSTSTCSSRSVGFDEKYNDIMRKLQILDNGMMPN